MNSPNLSNMVSIAGEARKVMRYASTQKRSHQVRSQQSCGRPLLVEVISMWNIQLQRDTSGKCPCDESPTDDRAVQFFQRTVYCRLNLTRFSFFPSRIPFIGYIRKDLFGHSLGSPGMSSLGRWQKYPPNISSSFSSCFSPKDRRKSMKFGCTR